MRHIRMPRLNTQPRNATHAGIGLNSKLEICSVKYIPTFAREKANLLAAVWTRPIRLERMHVRSSLGNKRHSVSCPATASGLVSWLGARPQPVRERRMIEIRYSLPTTLCSMLKSSIGVSAFTNKSFILIPGGCSMLDDTPKLTCTSPDHPLSWT